jgi:hypothetical protein
MTLRVSSDYLQLVTVKSHQILGKTAPLIDLLHVAHIVEIDRIPEEEEVIIRSLFDNNNQFNIKSPNYLQIVEVSVG